MSQWRTLVPHDSSWDEYPLADSWMKLEAARMMIYQGARVYDQGYTGGEYSNAGKYLATEAAFEACERAVYW
ncbi:hypothetical protein N7519_008117 [Penicillium mononematosum]|uniref:uncharacterized protein n=1 Tax=Penicillium mononematosum TaxID=268346 RepID=UPI002546AE78|nr:uncharacterized protein N7519_008117 [Penicillium mononematosum]KAJ6177656.1 hypothetical protein N7519_008117 [Penicillium mononematosum]